MARRIYKTTDRITVKIDDISIKISPLSYEAKCEIQAELISGQTLGIIRAAKKSMQYAIKEISGVENSDGSEYKLEFEDDRLTESCVDDLLNIDQDNKLSFVCTRLLEGIPKDFVNPQTGEKIEGIKIERPRVSGKKK